MERRNQENIKMMVMVVMMMVVVVVVVVMLVVVVVEAMKPQSLQQRQYTPNPLLKARSPKPSAENHEP